MVDLLQGKGDRELELTRKGLSIAGVDEVGRGCLAGPVYAAAVILSYDLLNDLEAGDKSLIRDSKALSRKQRARILPIVQQISRAAEIGHATVGEIEALGIVEATFLAMRRAVSMLPIEVDILLVDGNKKISNYSGRQETIIKGDSLCFAIAAASILAKESRDMYMTSQAEVYPGYGFENHVGYGTKEHLAGIAKRGICPLHRKNFAPISSHI